MNVGDVAHECTPLHKTTPEALAPRALLVTLWDRGYLERLLVARVLDVTLVA